jgi:SAM-dependent methyltransferase
MKIRDPHERLRTAWGLIDRQHNRLIAGHWVGRRVLDIGCGYGSLVAYLRSSGYEAEGIDLDRDAIEAGRDLFPENPIRIGNAESLDGWAPHSFDSITLKDSLHHLVCEGDFPSAARAFRRVLAPGGRLVILDPNPTWIVRLARRIAAHDDVEASPQRAHSELEGNGFATRGIEFFETVGLPLSGGYVGVRMVPNWQLCNSALAAINAAASAAVNAAGIGSRVCWRYILWADAAI